MYAHFTLDFYLLKENIIKTKRKIIPPEHDITPVVLAAVQILYLVIVSLYNLKKNSSHPGCHVTLNKASCAIQ